MHLHELPRIASATSCAALTFAGGLLITHLTTQSSELQPRSRDSRLVELHRQWTEAVHVYAASIGHSLLSGGIVPEQAWSYLDAARHNSSVVCEAGFFRGVSAHMWLYAHAGIILHSFDIRFPAASVAALSGAFGANRLHMHKGATVETLTQLRQAGTLCDIVSIDASHDGWDPYTDLSALLPSTRCNALVFFDDTFDDRAVDKPLDNEPSHASFYNACTRSYWRAVREGLVSHSQCIALGRRWRWGRFPKGFCVGRARGACHRDTAH